MFYTDKLVPGSTTPIVYLIDLMLRADYLESFGEERFSHNKVRCFGSAHIFAKTQFLNDWFNALIDRLNCTCKYRIKEVNSR